MDEPLRIHQSGASAGHPRILLVLDAADQGFAQGIAGTEGVELVGAVQTAEEAADLASELGPDLILIDLDLEGLRAGETLERIRSAGVPAKLVGLTRGASRERVGEAVRAGISAVVTRTDDADVLADVLRLVAEVGAPPGESPVTD